MKKVATFAIIFSLFVVFHPPVFAQEDNIPKWLKTDAKWWAEGEISDSEFVNLIEWSVNTKIIPVQYTPVQITEKQVPLSVKNIAYYWSLGKVSDRYFIETIQYLIRTGLVKLDESFHKEYSDELLKVSVFDDKKKAVVIIPTFTASAYSKGGFYEYYNGKCDTCTTTSIKYDTPLDYTSSQKAVQVLGSLGYKTITDIDVDKRPSILASYDKVIVLHNEYVTQNEFDAISSHPHVLYLYPNALYGKIFVDYLTNTMTLIAGHGYPSGTANGFGWEQDNTQYEYNDSCDGMGLYKVKNGEMLNCYPEDNLEYNISLLRTIKEF